MKLSSVASVVEFRMIGFSSNGIAARISVRGVQAGSGGNASAIVPVIALTPIAAPRIAAARNRRVLDISDISSPARRTPATRDESPAVGLAATQFVSSSRGRATRNS
jgi:hypothetical protein